MAIKIELTKGQVALIDDADGDLAEFKWYALTDRNGYYAVRQMAGSKQMMLLLHRVILERMTGRPLAKTEFTDHISGDKLDNRRTNLRIATRAENMQNRGKLRNNTSGYKGVSWHHTTMKWNARIAINGKRIHIGYFDTPEEAHAAYCAAALELHGEFAYNGAIPNDGETVATPAITGVE